MREKSFCGEIPVFRTVQPTFSIIYGHQFVIQANVLKVAIMQRNPRCQSLIKSVSVLIRYNEDVTKMSLVRAVRSASVVKVT